jgi:hypothetical protein
MRLTIVRPPRDEKVLRVNRKLNVLLESDESSLIALIDEKCRETLRLEEDE